MSRALRVVIMTGLLGFPAALAWLLWAEPARWLMSEGGLVMTQELVRGQFDVVVKFAIIGVLVGVSSGLVTVFMMKPITWRMVPTAMAGSLLASGICWAIAAVLGPQNPTKDTVVAFGDFVPAQFAVDAWPAWLAWPLGAVLMVTVAIYMSDDPVPTPKEPESVPPPPM